MNKFEKILAERMNFVTRRGRTAAWQRDEWLRNLRAERYGSPAGWLKCDFEGTVSDTFLTLSAPSWRMIKINAKKLARWQNEAINVYDSVTRILIFTA